MTGHNDRMEARSPINQFVLGIYLRWWDDICNSSTQVIERPVIKEWILLELLK